MWQKKYTTEIFAVFSTIAWTMCALCYTKINLLLCIGQCISKITNNLTVLPDQHIFGCMTVIVYFIVCVCDMYHCLIQPYGCKIPINDYYYYNFTGYRKFTDTFRHPMCTLHITVLSAVK